MRSAPKWSQLTPQTAEVDPTAVLGPNVVVGPGAKIGPGVRLQRCVVLSNAVIRDHAWIANSIIGWNSNVGRWVRVENITVLGDDVTIKDELYVNGASVLPHKSISSSITEPRIVMCEFESGLCGPCVGSTADDQKGCVSSIPVDYHFPLHSLLDASSHLYKRWAPSCHAWYLEIR